MAIPFLSSEEFDEKAHQLYQAGRYEEALALLRDGLQRFPDSADLHVGLAYIRVAREEFAWARESFLEALRIEPDHEDALVGLGETLLRFGEFDGALDCFARVDAQGLGADLEIGSAMARALYREGLFEDARDRYRVLVGSHPVSAELMAGLGFALHASGETEEAEHWLGRAVTQDPELQEAWVHLAHIRADRGDVPGATAAFLAVPASDHWDIWTVRRLLEISDGQHPDAAAYAARLAELDGSDLDETDRILLEIEIAADMDDSDTATPDAGPRPANTHRVRTADGNVYTGTWDEIVFRMRDELAAGEEPISEFMRRAAERVRKLTGRELPYDDPEAFVRASEEIGLLRIEA